MESWLQTSIELVKGSGIDVKQYDYRYFVNIFYDYFSQRNLAKFVSSLYDDSIDKIDIYFELGSILGMKDYDIHVVEEIMSYLKSNGFDEWAESDE